MEGFIQNKLLHLKDINHRKGAKKIVATDTHRHTRTFHVKTAESDVATIDWK